MSSVRYDDKTEWVGRETKEAWVLLSGYHYVLVYDKFYTVAEKTEVRREKSSEGDV